MDSAYVFRHQLFLPEGIFHFLWKPSDLTFRAAGLHKENYSNDPAHDSYSFLHFECLRSPLSHTTVGFSMYGITSREDNKIAQHVYEAYVENTTLMEYVRNVSLTGVDIHVTVVDDLPNPYKVMNEGAGVITFSWLLYGFIAITTIVTAHKLYRFIASVGPQFSTPQICLVLDLISLFSKFLVIPIVAHAQSNWSTWVLTPFGRGEC